MTSPIVPFYTGKASDHLGRRIEEMWSWDDQRLEATHDYIQWLFPLPTASRFSATAPILTTEDVAAFAADERLAERLRTSLSVMLRFYGLELGGRADSPVVGLAPSFEERAPHWVTRGNHNHLRLTRILRSLNLLGLQREAEALQAGLFDVAERIEGGVSSETVRFWRQALGSG
jgi:hypothetical protein